jgi:putative tryptophan/tyrosine transport system substrate-binding protein
MADFVKAARTTEIEPGQARLVEVNGKQIALFNIDGHFFAIDNTCTHRKGWGKCSSRFRIFQADPRKSPRRLWQAEGAAIQPRSQRRGPMLDIRRREFITLAVSTAAWPLAARAQQVRTPRRIGVLLVGLSPESKELKHFRLGLRDAGYAEGRDVVIEWRSANGDYDRVPALVADLVRSKVDVIVEDSTVGTEATKRATSTIPIVMALVLDPVATGLVQSLAHPGGNVTGLSMMATELYPKRLQLLKEINPQLTRIAVFWNPDHPFHAKAVEEVKAVAPSVPIEVSSAAVRTPDQFGPAFSDIIRANVQALYVIDDPIFFAHRTILLELASEARLPTIYETRRYPEAGAFISYGPDLYDLFRRSAIYVDRIFKGAKPADLPVEQPTKFELVINLKTAKALGIDVPPMLVALADDVIE